MTCLNGPGSGGVHRLQAADDFPTGEDLDLEVAVGHVVDVFRHRLRAAINRVERFGERRRQPPGDFRCSLRNGRRGQHGGAGGGDTAHRCLGQE
ncbi:hypothetical protein GALL_473360 [mine drainage metagenome]|uniref:Uncharacterized protein n=1 Tax=mine drainage metagenome TaxID=410659 RepID=A0A1J5PJQ8_9ZZZZ